MSKYSVTLKLNTKSSRRTSQRQNQTHVTVTQKPLSKTNLNNSQDKNQKQMFHAKITLQTHCNHT